MPAGAHGAPGFLRERKRDITGRWSPWALVRQRWRGLRVLLISVSILPSVRVECNAPTGREPPVCGSAGYAGPTAGGAPGRARIGFFYGGATCRMGPYGRETSRLSRLLLRASNRFQLWHRMESAQLSSQESTPTTVWDSPGLPEFTRRHRCHEPARPRSPSRPKVLSLAARTSSTALHFPPRSAIDELENHLPWTGRLESEDLPPASAYEWWIACLAWYELCLADLVDDGGLVIDPFPSKTRTGV